MTKKNSTSVKEENKGKNTAPKAAVTTKTTTDKAVKAEKKDKKDVAVSEKEADKDIQGKNQVPKKAVSKKSASKKKTEKNVEFYIQCFGTEYSYEELIEKVKANYAENTGKKIINSLRIYYKPEDLSVYYVVNEKHLGSIYLGR